jgi:hypothetical protein
VRLYHEHNETGCWHSFVYLSIERNRIVTHFKEELTLFRVSDRTGGVMFIFRFLAMSLKGDLSKDVTQVVLVRIQTLANNVKSSSRRNAILDLLAVFFL